MGRKPKNPLDGVVDTAENKETTAGATQDNGVPPEVTQKPQEDQKPPKTEKKPDMVEIKKEDYDRLMNQLDKNAKDIALLYQASDKSRMAKAMGEGGEILIKKVNIWTWDGTGRIIIATKLISNRSEVVLGKWYEDQSVMVIMEDGDNFTVPYLEFVRKTLTKIPAEVVARTSSFDEKEKPITVLKVRFDNGKTLEINSAFVN